MRKIRFNRHTFLSMIAMCATFTSCTSSEDFSPDVEPGVEDGGSLLTCEAAVHEYADPESRSSLTRGPSGMLFNWEAGDAITVFAKGDKDAVQIYKLANGAGEPTATFSTQNFQLSIGKLYYAFSKAKGDAHNVTITDHDDIIVDYEGQTQIGNGSTTHLGDYDFQTAGVLSNDASRAHFRFTSLSSTIRVVMSFKSYDDLTDQQIVDKELDPEEVAALRLTSDTENPNLKMVRFTELELFDKNNEYRQNKRKFSFTAGTSGVEGSETYATTWPTQNIETMDRFKLHLRSGGPNEEGVARSTTMGDGTENPTRSLVAYMEVPPYSFIYNPGEPDHNPLNFVLRGYYEKLVDTKWVKVPVSYVYERIRNQNFSASTAHQISFTPDKPDELKVTLNINHNWQHGDVVDNTSSAKSRATGDPGYDDKIHTPNYIYYIYCHDGKVVLPSTEVGASAVTMIDARATPEENHWSTRFDSEIKNYISTYIYKVGEQVNDEITLKKYKPTEIAGHTAHAGDCTRHLYVVASNTDISTSLSSVAVDNSEETVVRTLTYSIPGANQQVFMRDLYSTPWDDDNFEGNLVDAVQDITMYHVAAMVDVKWNTVNTAIANVSANDVKSKGLFLFKPTENTTDKLGGDTGYTATNSVEADQSNLGRTVFYLPQFKAPNCQYNIGFNSEDAIPVTFTPDVSKGYTSWLRWLKKKD